MTIPASSIVADWIDATGGRGDEPSYVERARLELEQFKQIAEQHFYDWKVDDLARTIAAAQQLELGLPARDTRAHNRELVADYLERVVLPVTVQHSVMQLPERLRECRQEFRVGVRPSDGKRFIRWDKKAGLPMLCPEDAREESARQSRRLVPKLLELRRDGLRVTPIVLTWPNCEPGKLRATMRRMFGRFRGVLKMKKDGRKRFPQIKGAHIVMEAPLGIARDWHPHLNVLLVTDGWMDYADLRAAWHWHIWIGKPIAGSAEAFEATMRELVKYPVRAIPEKSEAKHRRSDDPPAMIEWTATEWLEWWNAHRGVRRTRGYGVLYGLDDPEPQDTSEVVWIGTARWQRGRFVFDSPLLRSIPGDKSTTRDAREVAVEAFQHLYGPPGQYARALSVHRSMTESYKIVLAALEN